MDLTITLEEKDGRGRYVAHVPGSEETGELTFARSSPDTIVVEHVGVPASLGGKGVGTKLARHVVAEARAKGFRIVPVCPFVKALSKRNPDWKDVMAAG